MSRHQAAARFGIAVSTAVHWVRRYRGTTGSAAPAKMGGYKPRTLRDEHADWLIARCREKDFTISQLVEELQAVRGLKVDRHTVWDFLSRREAQLQKKACSPRSRIVPTSRGGVSSGGNIRIASIRAAWC